MSRNVTGTKTEALRELKKRSAVVQGCQIDAR
jgi:hypothetical protein